MTTNIIEHLENIKIFSDYKRSGLSTIELFWDYIEKGNNPKKIHEKKYSFRFDPKHSDYNPSDEEIEKALEERERFENTDWLSVYEDSVRSDIETSLNYDSAEFQQAMRLDEIYSKVIAENPNLNECLAISEDIFTLYCAILANDLPQKFFKKLSLYERNNQNKPINWLQVFEKIDIEKEIATQVHLTTTTKQKEIYFQKASFKLTLQYLLHFKKETAFLSTERKVAYIKAMNIEAPKISNTENYTFNQTVFEAKNNYYEFLKLYERHLTGLINNVLDENQNEKENDFIVSTIEDYLYPFLHDGVLLDKDYKNLIRDLTHYFKKGSFPKSIQKISVRKVNKKRFGWALNQIFRSNNDNNKTLALVYLKYIQSNISIFETDYFNEKNYLKSNFYKYLTTKT